MRNFRLSKYKKFDAIVIDDVARKTVFLRFVCWTGIVFLFPMGTLAYFQHNLFLWLTDWGIAATLVANLVYLRITRKLRYVIFSNTCLVAIFFIYLLVTGGVNNTAFVWSYVFPLFSLFLLGPVKGSLANLFFFIPIVGFLLFEPRVLNFTTYPADLKLRYIPSFIVVFIYSFIFEYMRSTSNKHLNDQNNELERLVAELTTTKDALLEAKATLEQRVQERTGELAEQVAARQRALNELAAAQSSLLEASRVAGMAEVATGVLHNVGNVLNSVNVSCTLLLDQLGRSRVGNVAKVAEMLDQAREDLARFVTEDPRGRQIPDYLASLAEALGEEHRILSREAEALRGRIDHIKEIVSMQQSYGRVLGVSETIAPEQLMEDALKLYANSLAQHGISVRRAYAPTDPITVDKHAVLQILLNLINNAKNACAEAGNPGKCITLTLGVLGADRVCFQVGDNGVGITAENMTRIFQHGFTTRKSGHGFGLHSGALAARQLGGRLSAHSDGPGAGATFTLELPCRPGEAA
jgi:signal transduction histidine kinase